MSHAVGTQKFLARGTSGYLLQDQDRIGTTSLRSAENALRARDSNSTQRDGPTYPGSAACCEHAAIRVRPNFARRHYHCMGHLAREPDHRRRPSVALNSPKSPKNREIEGYSGCPVEMQANYR